jgi:hypothetical protein
MKIKKNELYLKNDGAIICNEMRRVFELEVNHGYMEEKIPAVL